MGEKAVEVKEDGSIRSKGLGRLNGFAKRPPWVRGEGEANETKGSEEELQRGVPQLILREKWG